MTSRIGRGILPLIIACIVITAGIVTVVTTYRSAMLQNQIAKFKV